MTVIQTDKPWEDVRQHIASGDATGLLGFLDRLGPAETARAVSRLTVEEHGQMLTLLAAPDAADVIEEIPETQAVDLIEDLPPEQAAAIVDALPSNLQADVMAELDAQDREAILEEMAPEQAAELRQVMDHPANTAGGLMATEYLAYRDDYRISDVISSLQANREEYADYSVQYVYVIDAEGRLVGVLRMRDLIFTSRAARLSDVMIPRPLRVYVDSTLEHLKEFFGQHRLLGVPVVDENEHLVGMIRRVVVEEAELKQANRQFLRISGIIGGEEFRSMPLLVRSGRRLSWLSINIVLNIVAASIIALYQDTLRAVIALAVFLPMISDMSGCSGNQAVAVSMRELTLGLVRVREFLRVFLKEAAVGLVNGAALGLLLGGVALLWKGNPYLGLVVGGALAVNTVVAVSVGGLLPLILKGLRLDPALVSGPILTTVTDICGFFVVLSMATILLPRLVA